VNISFLLSLFLLTSSIYLLFWSPRHLLSLNKINNLQSISSSPNQTTINYDITNKKYTPLEVLDLLAQYLKIEPNTHKTFTRVFGEKINLQNSNEIIKAFYNKCTGYSKKKHIKTAAINTILALEVTNVLGIPLYKTLLQTKKSLSNEMEAINAWKMSTAGARTTAKILQYLPLLGIGIGYLFGVNPLGVFLDLSFGTGLCAIGLTLNIIGIRWIKSMEKKIWQQFYF
jgi:hypothetical protein